MPPMAEPCPPIHLVSELTTMSAPCSIERKRQGVVKVASTISGTLCFFAIAETASMSVKSRTGLPIVSMKMPRVFPLMSFSKLEGSLWSAKRTVIPRSGRIASNIV